MTEITDERLPDERRLKLFGSWNNPETIPNVNDKASPGSHIPTWDEVGRMARELLRRRAQDKVAEAAVTLADAVCEWKRHGHGGMLSADGVFTGIQAYRAAREAAKEPDEAEKVVAEWIHDRDHYMPTDTREALVSHLRRALARSRGE